MSYPVVVQTLLGQNFGGAFTTAAITTTPGNLLVALVVSFQDHIGASPIADSKVNTWIPAIASTGTTEGFAALFYVNGISGGSGHTFTITPTANDYLSVVVFEISGAAVAGVLGNTSATSASSTTHNSGNVTSDASLNCLLIGGGAISRGAEGTPVVSQVPPWQSLYALTGSTLEGLACGTRAVSPSVTDQFTYTTSSTNRETALVAVFKGLNADPTSVKLTQEVIEVFTTTDPSVKLTQEVVEVFTQTSPPVYLTQTMLEVWLGGHPPVKLTQEIVEVWYIPRDISNAPMFIADQDGVGDDIGEEFQAYIISRAFIPSGRVNVQGAVRESYLTARSASAVPIQMTLLRDFGKGQSLATVNLTPSILGETRVTRKFEDMGDADIVDCQIRVGDSVPVANYWSLDVLFAQTQTEGEE